VKLQPIATMGTLLRSCVKMREPIELSFGKVSGFYPVIDVLGGVHVPQEEVTDFGVVCPIGPRFQRPIFEEKCIRTRV